MSNVLYVPDLQLNLFKARCVLDKGYIMIPEKEKCEIRDKMEMFELWQQDKINSMKSIFNKKITLNTSQTVQLKIQMKIKSRVTKSAML